MEATVTLMATSRAYPLPQARVFKDIAPEGWIWVQLPWGHTLTGSGFAREVSDSGA